MLKATAAGVGGLSLAGFSGEVATAKTGCANGPYESSYDPGTVNVGRIRAEQAKGEVPARTSARRVRAAAQEAGAANSHPARPPRSRPSTRRGR